MYKQSFYITKRISNNVFSFEKRVNPRLYVPVLRTHAQSGSSITAKAASSTGTVEDVKVGSEVVFEDHAFYFWHAALLDFFAPELDYIPEKIKLDVLRKIMPHVQLITIATSPFFIEQERAIDYLKILVQNYSTLRFSKA